MNIAAVAFFSAFLTGFSPNFQKVSCGADINASKTTVINTAAFQTMYFYESNSLNVDAGVRLAYKETDVLCGFSVFPFQFDNWKFGLLSRVHFRNEGEDYNQVDFFAGFDFVITPLKWLEINPRIAYYFCASEIIPLRDYGTQWYYNNAHYVCLNIYFMPADWIRLSLGATNCEYFYYRLFGSASFSIGSEFYTPIGITFGAEIISRWTDIVTLSGNYDGTDVKLTCGYRW